MYKSFDEWMDEVEKNALPAECCSDSESEWARVAWDIQQEKIEKLENILRKVFPEKSGHFFICGEAGEKDSSGLPDKIFVCPTYGLDGFQVYKKDGDYRAPGW